MPGLSLVICNNLDNETVVNALADLKHESNYILEKLVDNKNTIAAFSGYDNYPRKAYKLNQTNIFIEGLIYNKTEDVIERELLFIAESYINDSDYQILIKQFIDTSDGEFNILIFKNLSEDFIIFNDRWGRLPSFYYYDKDMFVFSREIKLILHFIPQIEVNRLAIAEFLLFECILGEKTLINNIYRMTPSSLVRLERKTSGIDSKIIPLININFDSTGPMLSRNGSINSCKNYILDSIKVRANKMQEMQYNITADLSGGTDTRVIFGGLNLLDINVDYYTEYLATGDESEYAIKIATLYGKQVTMVVADHDLIEAEMQRLAYITDCGVNSWTTYTAYCDQRKRTCMVPERSVQFSGLGANTFLKGAARPKIKSDSLLNLIMSDYYTGFGRIKSTCSLIKMEQNEIYSHFKEYLDSYPETTFVGKLKHFIFELKKLVSAGEDRGRLLIWPVQPLWSKDFLFFSAIKVPTKYTGMDYYLDIIRSIDPNLLTVPVFSSTIISKSWKNNLKDGIKWIKIVLSRISQQNSIVYGLSRIYIRRTLAKPNQDRDTIIRYIFNNFSKLTYLSNYFDKKYLNDFIAEAPLVPLSRLLSLILYFIDIENRYQDKIVNSY